MAVTLCLTVNDDRYGTLWLTFHKCFVAYPDWHVFSERLKQDWNCNVSLLQGVTHAVIGFRLVFEDEAAVTAWMMAWSG